jgi:GT2 family glycosyltransferase
MDYKILFTMSFSVIIPTYKRPDSLQKTIESLLLNSLLPDEILIIDDDQIPTQLLTDLKSSCEGSGVALKYYKKNHKKIRKGLSESKNWAATLASGDIIFYLDDDVVLNINYCAELMSVWSAHKDDSNLIGVGGRISNNRRTSTFEKIYRNLFGLTGECAWDVNSVGFQVWDEGVSVTQKAYYLHGGVSSYRRSLIIKYPFATFSGGRTGLEDVEHCLRTKLAGYHFYYVPDAHLTHHPALAGRELVYAAAKKESVNRREIFNYHCNKNLIKRLHFAWANVGWIGKKIVTGQWVSARGLVAGLFVS